MSEHGNSPEEIAESCRLLQEIHRESNRPSNQQCAKEIRPAEDVLWHLREATREAELLCRAGIIEVAVRNPSVAEYMKHWEGRATAAEKDVELWREKYLRVLSERDQARRDCLNFKLHGNIAGATVETTGEPTTTTTQLPPVAGFDSQSFCGDPGALYNSRCWLQKALEAKGAKIEGAGCGGGGADLDIVLEGCKFNVFIKPR